MAYKCEEEPLAPGSREERRTEGYGGEGMSEGLTSCAHLHVLNPLRAAASQGIRGSLVVLRLPFLHHLLGQ